MIIITKEHIIGFLGICGFILLIGLVGGLEHERRCRMGIRKIRSGPENNYRHIWVDKNGRPA